MTNVMIHGWKGRMGQVLSQLICEKNDLELVAGVDAMLTDEDIDAGDLNNASCRLYRDLNDCSDDIDVIIDFSVHDAVSALLDYCRERKIPAIIATTGLGEEDLAKLEETSREVGIFKSANMSLGINVMARVLRQMTAALEENFNIEIVEKHHNQKKDSPSGTAILLADAINSACREEKTYVFGRHGNNLENPISEMGIHAVRGGTIAGEHEVIYAGPQEILEIKHTALSREIFAHGALSAAVFMAGKPAGLYSMDDMLG